MTDRLTFYGGEIDRPEGWDMHLELAFVEPRSTLEAPLTMGKSLPRPRANLVVRTVDVGWAEVGEALDQLAERQTRDLRGLRMGAKEDFAFHDGATGAILQVGFDAAPSVRARQCHVLRKEGSSALHFVATVDERSPERLEQMLGVIRSFTPARP